MNNYRKQKINEAISKSLFIGEKIKELKFNLGVLEEIKKDLDDFIEKEDIKSICKLIKAIEGK